jgi:hypothetical protein
VLCGVAESTVGKVVGRNSSVGIAARCGLDGPGIESQPITLAERFKAIRATCPAHLSLLDLITRMIFGEEDRA